MRIPTQTANHFGMVNQWFQDFTPTFNGGQTMWIADINGRLYLANRFVDDNNDCNPISVGCVDLGPIPYDQWKTYQLTVFLSTNPSLGRMDLTIDGVPAGTIIGQTVFSESEVTRFHFQLVSFNGSTTSTADYDDGRISTPVQ